MNASPPANQHTLHCLIVEDQVMFLQLLRSMLEAIPGLEVRATATCQAEAIALCRADEPPELLILDLSLPDGDGLEVAHTLAEHRPDAKVVVLSGQASSFVCPAPLRPLIVGVVDKTAAFSQLQAVLESCLPQPNAPLTLRQQEIYGLIGQGLSNKEIARTTALSIATVETHRKAIAQKLGMSGAELVRQASLLGRLNQEHLRSCD
ncbi:response regulator transcription factor [Synechococcus sp. CBW1107]|uniref:response regulator transcription factor n=1 Tax=Synechococcus sp. CBW1107 TaxID=2789857 RepID=UPI002AD3C07A|nr:response regulator transcription factor [Synechococcus sp. CBW1107]CAK6694978.1 Transcriptional regulatory protein LiaR [Synechococcus sp. CBW1107]